jgi:hypothetical protein
VPKVIRKICCARKQSLHSSHLHRVKLLTLKKDNQTKKQEWVTNDLIDAYDYIQSKDVHFGAQKKVEMGGKGRMRRMVFHTNTAETSENATR